MWATPQAFFDQLNAEFDFNLDPCATPENAKCATFFTKEVDGLKQNWGGGTECFAIRLMAEKSRIGLKKPTKKVRNQILPL